MNNTLLIKPEDYENELRQEAIKVGKEQLLKEYVVLHDKVHNATSENPCDITDERELQEIEYMLDYLEIVDPSDIPF
jgi:hypothetical protein